MFCPALGEIATAVDANTNPPPKVTVARTSRGYFIGWGLSIKDVHKIWHCSPPSPPVHLYPFANLPLCGRPLHMVTLQHSVPVIRFRYSQCIDLFLF